jgi:hypothetical protein
MIIATKYIEDNSNYVTAFYKVVAPLYSAKEINEMERSFLGVIKVRLLDKGCFEFFDETDLYC